MCYGHERYRGVPPLEELQTRGESSTTKPFAKQCRCGPERKHHVIPCCCARRELRYDRSVQANTFHYQRRHLRRPLPDRCCEPSRFSLEGSAGCQTTRAPDCEDCSFETRGLRSAKLPFVSNLNLRVGTADRSVT